MKVIKEGKLPTYTGTCGICGAVINAEYGESAMFWTNKGSSMSFTCPTKGCGQSINVYAILEPQQPAYGGV